ncbi:dihydropteroate synthase [Svornostia abyssi]|uniref:Dihydropteroate synthase n=2 Tax=Svornostia abyssi TaxID=2898438 RepID=A0ABY5PFI9_9ACTN|nr:dihydropteroate synthase [Parviterribacteraceae bacterium J379]
MAAPDPIVMGIVNVTPDSFSDGGRWLDPAAAIAHGLRLAADGAAILDVGGESTRPGAAAVSADEERRRVVPVIQGLTQAGVRVSVDTMKAVVAEAALDAGATLVNDVAALRDPDMAALVADRGCEVCLVHMRGEPRTMQDDPHYDDVVDDVRAFLTARVEVALAAGVARERIVLDPGIGFGKTVDHNLELLDRLDELAALGFPVLVGTSRKSFLGKIVGRDTDDRLPGTIATNVLALARGASIFRVHDVAPVRDALAVAAATLARTWTTPAETMTTSRTTTSTTATRTSRTADPRPSSPSRSSGSPSTPTTG